MKKSFFGRYVPFFGNRAIVILCAVFFLLPFALRGARLAVNEMKNDVTDWLPKSYDETEDLAIFRQFFLGDQFIVITWPGCREDDPTYVRLLSKLKRESLESDEQLTSEERRARETGDKFALHSTGNYHEDWGAHGEKWLRGRDGWFFIQRDGSLYQWDGDDNIVQAVARGLDRYYNGKNKATGKFITRFQGDAATGIPSEVSPFYQDPSKLTARFFKKVTSGPEIFNKLAGPEGVLRMGQYDDSDQATFFVKLEAHQKLTGLLFGPTPPRGFDWTFESLLAVLEEHYPEKKNQLDASRQQLFDQFVQAVLASKFNGELAGLQDASQDDQLAYWYDMWDKLQLEAPKRQTCIVAYLNDPALDDMSRVIGRPLLGKPRGRILELASGQCGIDPDNLHVGGPPVDNVAIDEEGSITLLKLVGLSAFIGIGLAYVSFRSVRLTLMLFFVGGVAAVSSLSFVWFAGSTLDAILMTMPSLVYVLGISGAVHIVNYYREAQVTDPDRPVEMAIKHGWFPCTLAAFTTALGLISLYTSYLTPIRKFGIFSAFATVATVLLLFSFLPAALYVWPSHRRKETRKVELRPRTPWLENFFDALAQWIVRRHAWIVVSFLIMIAIFCYGATKVRTTVHLLKLFDPSAKILTDYRWLEENLGALVPMEILIRVDPEAIALRPATEGNRGPTMAQEFQFEQLSMLERTELSRRVREELARVFGPEGSNVVGAGTSTDTFVPLYVVDSNLPTFRRTELNSSLEEHRQDIARDTEYFRIDYDTGGEYWRISLRLAALADVDYGQFIREIQKVVEPVLAAYRARDTLLSSVDTTPLRPSGPPPAESTEGPPGSSPLRILLVGASETTNRRAAGDEIPAGTIDQHEIFERTLSELLQNRGFAPIERKKRQPRIGYYWLTPKEHQSLSEHENWIDVVGRFELVVALQDLPGVETQMIRDASRTFVDLRSIDFQTTAATMDEQDPASTSVHAAYTGIVPIVYKAQRSLLESLRQSIMLSFAMIALVMMLLLRNWRERIRLGNLVNIPAGMLSMLPNVFPVVIVFGGMGLLGRKVDIGSMMTASVAMGIAVDDTIHFLNWYRQALNQGLDRADAIRATYGRVAKAMLQTTLIAGIGLSAFAFSTFTPTQRFGVMMLVLLAFALVGDLIFLPALLVSPLGRAFGKPAQPQPESARHVDDAVALDAVEANSDPSPVSVPQSANPATASVRADAPSGLPSAHLGSLRAGRRRKAT